LREHAHELLDRLDPERLAAVVHLLEAFLPDQEGDTLSPAEAKAIAEADGWLKHNDPIPHEKVLAEFGLSVGGLGEDEHRTVARMAKRIVWTEQAYR
jgi:hypothetical protein